MKFDFNPTNLTDVLGRRYVQIDLTQPFERIVAGALALPQGLHFVEDKQVVRAGRALYEAINGRSVETTIGVVPIAPGVCPWLLIRQLEVGTREDFVAAAQRWLGRVATERGVIVGRDADRMKLLPNGYDDMLSAVPVKRGSCLTAQRECHIENRTLPAATAKN